MGYNIGNQSDEELAALFRDGRGQMPSVSLTPEEVPVLIAYLRTTFTHGR
jgi:hypothetical protein